MMNRPHHNLAQQSFIEALRRGYERELSRGAAHDEALRHLRAIANSTHRRRRHYRGSGNGSA